MQNEPTDKLSLSDAHERIRVYANDDTEMTFAELCEQLGVLENFALANGF